MHLNEGYSIITTKCFVLQLKYLSMGCQAPSHFHFLLPFFCFLISWHMQGGSTGPSSASPPLRGGLGTTPAQHFPQGEGKDAAPCLPPAASWVRSSPEVQALGFCRLQTQNRRVFSVHTHIKSLIHSNLLHQSAVKGTSVGENL